MIVNQRQKYGLYLIEDIITVLCMKLIKYSQEKRMRLNVVKNVLEVLEEYTSGLMRLV